MNKSGKRLCSHGEYILVGEEDSKQMAKICSIEDYKCHGGK